MSIKHSLRNALVRATAATKNGLSFVNEHGVDIAKDAATRAKEFASDISKRADIHNEAKAQVKAQKAYIDSVYANWEPLAESSFAKPSQPSQFSDECNNMIDPNEHDQS
jgi:hypothetical protein|tara:strand:+ start:229 stop:555 length:327 start_codon:yes stop_codon:yes gene_type:complete